MDMECHDILETRELQLLVANLALWQAKQFHSNAMARHVYAEAARTLSLAQYI